MSKGSGGTRGNGRPVNSVSASKVDKFLNGETGWTVDVNKIFKQKYNEADDKIARAGWIDSGTIFAPKGTVETVNARDIQPGQAVVGNENLRNIAKSMASEGQKEIPFGIRVGSKIILLDGHHRVGAQIISGQNTVKVRLLNISLEDWKAHGGK